MPTNRLKKIGVALAAAVSGLPSPLTDDQRSALARAKTRDVANAIATALRDKPEFTVSHLASLDTAWSSELRAAFADELTLMALSMALDSDDPQLAIIDLVSSDARLTGLERFELQGALATAWVARSEARQVDTQHARAYVKSISVRGFRGIGPQTELAIEDGPGLTVVYGPNGSGKSSFVEAFDVLLTAGTGRFDGRGPEWRGAWNNLHESAGGSISATFTFATLAGNSPSVTLKRSWTGNRFMAAAYDESPSRQMRQLGWLTALDEFKPVLGYEELGPLFEEEVIVQHDEEADPELPTKAVANSRRRTETSLARHIRLRTGVSDHLIGPLWTTAQTHRKGLLGPAAMELLGPLRGRLRVQHKKRQSTATLRAQAYLEMLVDAIYKIRLAPFSQRVADIWSTVRPGSAVRFDGLTLRQVVDHENRLTLRASLGLTVDGVEGLERGVLSQGELHSLALSVFLPTMMRPESPFGFAVIDDPVQVMDEHAVDGLAQVLEEATEDLQVIVFTHDKRLVDALRVHDINHHLVNVTRSRGSVVQCEVVSDPVEQTLEGARIDVEESPEDDESWAEVGYHCRQALELACIRAARRTIRGAGGGPDDVRTLVDEVVARERRQVRKLMALAIWGDADRMEEVGDYVNSEENWGAWVNETLETINALTHKDPDGIQKARSVYNGSRHDLIDATRRVAQTIEENCV